MVHRSSYLQLDLKIIKIQSLKVKMLQKPRVAPIGKLAVANNNPNGPLLSYGRLGQKWRNIKV